MVSGAWALVVCCVYCVWGGVRAVCCVLCVGRVCCVCCVLGVWACWARVCAFCHNFIYSEHKYTPFGFGKCGRVGRGIGDTERREFNVHTQDFFFLWHIIA